MLTQRQLDELRAHEWLLEQLGHNPPVRLRTKYQDIPIQSVGQPDGHVWYDPNGSYYQRRK